jgi:hypothetical protein
MAIYLIDEYIMDELTAGNYLLEVVVSDGGDYYANLIHSCPSDNDAVGLLNGAITKLKQQCDTIEDNQPQTHENTQKDSFVEILSQLFGQSRGVAPSGLVSFSDGEAIVGKNLLDIARQKAQRIFDKPDAIKFTPIPPNRHGVY